MQDSEKKRERERDRETETETEKERRLSSYMWGFGCMAGRNKEAMTSSPVFILSALTLSLVLFLRVLIRK